MNKQTETTENITFVQLLWWAVVRYSQFSVAFIVVLTPYFQVSSILRRKTIWHLRKNSSGKNRMAKTYGSSSQVSVSIFEVPSLLQLAVY